MFCLRGLVVLVMVNGAFENVASFNSILNTRSVTSTPAGLSTSIIDSVASGAQMAMTLCQKTFKWDRWNCPESAFSRRQNQPATREMAYVRALISASIVHSVTRNCSRGEIEGCGCDPNLAGRFSNNVPGIDVDPKEAEELSKNLRVDWSWGGCSDYVEFGEQVARGFLDDSEQGRDVQAYAHLHNNLAGRQVVKQSMIKRCKCHGVSGSCEVQTCWMQVAPFAEIASTLKERYNKAVYIDYQKTLGNSVAGNNRVPTEKNLESLVYLEESPDYCLANKTTGWLGTKGRTCSKANLETASFSEKKSCRNLCRSCGHKVRKQKRQVKTRCNCKFNWCCDVTCDTCDDMVEEYFCE